MNTTILVLVLSLTVVTSGTAFAGERILTNAKGVQIDAPSDSHK